MPRKQPERLALGRLCTRQACHVFTIKTSETARLEWSLQVGDAGKSMVLVLRGSLVVKKKARRMSPVLECILMQTWLLAAARDSAKPFLKRASSCWRAPGGGAAAAWPCHCSFLGVSGTVHMNHVALRGAIYLVT